MQKLLSFILICLLAVSLVGQAKIGGTAKVSGTVKISVSAGGGGGGSDFVTDTYTEGSDLTLASHTPELGGAITKHTGAAYVSTATIDNATDRLFPAGTTAYYYDGTPPSADYYVQTDLVAVSVVSVSAGPCGHIDTAADNMVCVRINNGTSWDLREIVGGTGATLGTSSSNLPTAGQTRTIKLTFSLGGTKAAVSIDGVEVIAATTIVTVTAAGKAGLRFSGGAGPSSGFHLDNFSAR